MKCFFSSSDTFLFWLAFCCTLSWRQPEEVDGEGHLNKPSVEPGSRVNQVRSNLWFSSSLFPHRGPSEELLEVWSPACYFLSPLFSSASSPFLSHLHIFLFCVHLQYPPLFLYFISLSFFIPLFCSQASWPAVLPDRVSTAVWVKLSYSSRGRWLSSSRLASPTPLPPLDTASMTQAWPGHHNKTFF